MLVKHCLACDTPHHYPRSICPFCGSDRTEWRESTGRGEVYSFTPARRGVAEPFVLAYVTLDEGVTMLTNIEAEDPDSVHIGQRVRVVFRPVENDLSIPVFVAA